MLLGTRCTLCHQPGRALCATCLARMPPAPTLPSYPALDDCRALVAYEGAGRDLVVNLKYRNARAGLEPLGRALAVLVGGHASPSGERPAVRPVVTWAPTSVRRRRRRGFDQAELVARALARALGCPCRSLLVRLDGPPQTGRSAHERLGGPRFAVIGPCRIGPVFIVDDVLTTGATLSAAARALGDAGAYGIRGVVLAATPRQAGATVSR